jgi:putative flippase GtrA
MTGFVDLAAHLLSEQWVRFLLAGGLSTASYYVIFVPLARMRLHHLVCAICAFVPSFTMSFLLQKFWTFESTSIEAAHQEFA